MEIGYARISTEEQNLNLQRHALAAAGCAAIHEDRGLSGAARARPGTARLKIGNSYPRIFRASSRVRRRENLDRRIASGGDVTGRGDVVGGGEHAVPCRAPGSGARLGATFPPVVSR
jgi:Resolvase, N terminal domain